jgi:hypothetical protein
MKHVLFCYHPQNVFRHRNYPNGWEFITTLNEPSEAFTEVMKREDPEFFPQDDGSVKDSNGTIVYDLNYPDRYEFGDYTYYIEDVDNLTPRQTNSLDKTDDWKAKELYNQLTQEQ